jgi:predicted cupin superfamily sugar epimerase
MLRPGVAAASLSRLGPDVLGGEVPQLIVPGGVWQGARLAAGAGRGWALMSCTMAPAWDERECELAGAARCCGNSPRGLRKYTPDEMIFDRVARVSQARANVPG